MTTTPKKTKAVKTPQEAILELKDPMQMFDLVCAYNYFAGKFNNVCPVDESREVFEGIRKLILLEIRPLPEKKVRK